MFALLQLMDGHGSNPGALRAWTHRPVDLDGAVPLVVVLHGAGQTAREYDAGAGWSRLADQCGFALLFPEQTVFNHPLRAFNWYASKDNRRSAGEAFSMRQMIDGLQSRGGVDPKRIFVTGLSSGGAMAAVMLATYPEVFAGGAVIAGVPYGSASGVLQAMDRMNGLGGPTPDALEAALRAASRHRGPWPILSIWHGSDDRTVDASNVEGMAGQWRALHRIEASDVRSDLVEGFPHRTWIDAAGRAVLEVYSITGMGHGTPLRTTGADGLGVSGMYMLEARISSTRLIARFWGIAEAGSNPVRSDAAPTAP